jgi:hypothetical protein
LHVVYGCHAKHRNIHVVQIMSFRAIHCDMARFGIGSRHEQSHPDAGATSG